MGIKATTVGYTFTAKTLKFPKTPKLCMLWPFLSEAGRQRIREQFLAMSASMTAFEGQMRRVSETMKMRLAPLKRQIEGVSARWAAKDDPTVSKMETTATPSPFGWIVDVIAAHPGPKGGSTLLIPRKVESIEDAIERLASSTTWRRDSLRYVADVLKQSGEFDYWRIPKMVEWVVQCHTSGGPIDPHVLVRIARAYRFAPRKPA